ncbi:MarR family transcriptional regulator [Haloplanus litoreus]|uniref:MarR family transcriptional regulator n=1 Tax=Haloplanus litoreus TaxID=767515 RepID=A0ABD5ZZ09_9EURY
MTVYVETAPHEFTANYLFNERGLFPFFAADRRVKRGDGSAMGTFTHDGEEWQARLSYQESGLQHPGDTTPQGTRFDIETVREYRLNVSSLDDSVGQRKFNVHLAPRWPGMESKNGKGIPIPEGFDEGINLRVSGANIEFKQYLLLIRRAFGAVDIQPEYFADPHPYSNVQDAERYVRLNQEVSGPVHARDGPIARLGHLLEDDRSGYRKVVQNDQNGRGETHPGYYHTVTLGQDRIQEALPSHELPKEIKHYYAREAKSFSKEDLLSHPKLGASYQVNRWDGKLGVSPEELEQLSHELDETVLSTLANSNLDLRPGGNTYVSDAYFSASESDREREIVEFNTAQIEQTQESVVIKHLADGLSPIEWESLEMLVSDGGNVSPNDIADQYDRHPDSVRRALNRIDDLVNRSYDEVSLQSSYVAELVHDTVRQARDATRRATEAAAKAVEAAETGLDKRTTAFITWAASHGMNVTERGDELELRLGEVTGEDHRKEVRRILREGFKLWKQANRDPAVYRAGEYRYQYREKEHHLRSIESDMVTRRVTGRVWETLG